MGSSCAFPSRFQEAMVRQHWLVGGLGPFDGGSSQSSSVVRFMILAAVSAPKTSSMASRYQVT